MFSLQQLFSKSDRFLELLEASAGEAHTSVQALVRFTKAPESVPTLEDFVMARRKEKRIHEEISEYVVNTFVTGLEREDIEALSTALYKIPKAAEKFAERYIMGAAQLKQVDFSLQVHWLEQATETVVLMVKQLRHIQEIEKIKELGNRLQYIEGEADKLILALLGDVYSGKYPPLQALMLKDLFELLEKVIDRCRDAGNVVVQIFLKNA